MLGIEAVILKGKVRIPGRDMSKFVKRKGILRHAKKHDSCHKKKKKRSNEKCGKIRKRKTHRKFLNPPFKFKVAYNRKNSRKNNSKNNPKISRVPGERQIMRVHSKEVWHDH